MRTFLFLCLASVTSCLSFAYADTITLRADEYSPFNGDPTSDHPGYMIEIAKVVLEKKGHKVDYQIMPWARSIKEVEAGKIDAIVCAGKGDAPNFIFPEYSQGVNRYAIFKLKENPWAFNGVASLKSITLGYIEDYSYAATFDNYISDNKSNPKLLKANSGDTALQQNIEMLNRKRIGAVFTNPEVFVDTLKKMNLSPDNYTIAGLAPEVDPTYIAFSPAKKSSATYAKLISDGTVALRKSGELQKILDHYGLQDWESSNDSRK